MAAFNLTVDDSSPLITYSAGGWIDASNDTFLSQYQGSSYHSTSTPGATASFTFVGTGVYLFGAHRPSYGQYSVTIDGQSAQANANGPGFALQPLASIRDLPMGSHTVVLTNQGSGIDLDEIVVEAQIGSTGQTLDVKVMDDTDPLISYLPTAQAWGLNNGTQFTNGTLHFSQTTGAQISLNFTGEAVALYGAVSTDHASYTISIDSGPAVTVIGQGTRLHTQTLTYFTAGLSPGEHQLLLSALPPSGGGPQGFIDLDQVSAFSALGSLRSTPQSKPSTPSAAPSGDAAHPSSKTFTLIATISGVVIGLLLLFIVAFVIWRVRRRRKGSSTAHRRLFSIPNYRPKSSNVADVEKRDSWHLPLQAPPLYSPTEEFVNDPTRRISDTSSSTEFVEVPLIMRNSMFPTRRSVDRFNDRDSRYSDDSNPTYPSSVYSMYYNNDRYGSRV